MTTKSALRSTGRWLAVGVGSAAASYVAYVSYAWARYGDARPAARPEEQDALLDRFMPAYEIAERHQIRINAPAEITFETARDLNLQQSPWGRRMCLPHRDARGGHRFCGHVGSFAGTGRSCRQASS
jgi:hypothetical protein